MAEPRHAGSSALPWWPLGVLLFGFPVAWPLGLTEFLPPAMACVMVALLARQRRWRLVPGVTPLLLLAAWTLPCALMIDTFGRLLGWGMRLSTLAAVAVVVVYTTNAPEQVRRGRVIAGLITVWATVVVGGWLAVLWPDLTFTTLAGRLVPRSLMGNQLVHDLLAPTMAEVQTPWGAPKPFDRPAAPFPYANGWGAAIVVLTPVAVVALLRARGRVRWLVGALLAASVVPAVHSSNRGMFLGLGVSAAYVLLRLATRGRGRALVATALGVGVVGGVLLRLGALDLIASRLEYSRSTGGRASLYAETWHRTLESPIFGWGAPRPSLHQEVSVGTQGYVWTVLFSYGLVGLALFALFLLGAIARTWAVADEESLILHSSLIGAATIVCFYGLDIMQWLTVGTVAALLLRGPERRLRRLGNGRGTPRRVSVIELRGVLGAARASRGVRRVVAGAAVVSLAGGAIGASANLLLALVIGRGLGTAQAGLFFQLVALVSIVSNVLELGADTGLVRFVSGAMALGRPRRVRVLLVIAVGPVAAAAVLTVAVGWTVAPWGGPWGGPLGASRGWGALVLAVCGAGALLSVVLGAVRALSSAVPVTLVQSVGLPLARLVAVGLCMVVGFTAWRSAALAWLAPVPLALLAGVLLLRGSAPLRTSAGTRVGLVRALSGAEAKRFWAFSGPRAVSAAAEIGLEWADVLIVGAICSAADAAVYAVVTRVARAAELVQQASRVAVGPVLGAALARRDHDRVRRVHADVSVGMVLVSWPFLALVAWFAPQVLGVFGPEFSTGSGALRMLCGGMALSYAFGSVQSVLLMGGRSAAQLGNKVGCLAANIALDLVLVPREGIWGAALAWAICLVADAALAWWQIARGLRLSLRLRPALVAGVITAALSAVVCLAATTAVGAPPSEASALDSLRAPGAAAGALAVIGVVAGLAARRRLGSGRGAGRHRAAYPTPGVAR